MSRLHDGGPILSGRQVRVATQPMVITEKSQPENQSVITLRREGDVIREIHIRCGCGEMIVLECDYATGNVASTHRHPNFPQST